MVSKHNIINGLVRFMENDMAKASGSVTSKLIVTLAKNVLKRDENILDVFLNNPMLKTLVQENNGMYDLSTLMTILKDTANELGNISLYIPKIPILLPNGDEIKLSSTDVNTIENYINQTDFYRSDLNA